MTPPARRRPVWQRRLSTIAALQAPILLALGAAMLLPLGLAAWESRGLPARGEVLAFALPAALCASAGALLRRRRGALHGLDAAEALLVTTAAWLTASLAGCLPFVISGTLGPLDAVFESVSGFTTAGTTMLVGLDRLPHSVLLWRALSQWIGGLGILLVVLLLRRSKGSESLSLLTAEGVKVASGRLSLNFHRASYQFAVIYAILSAATFVGLRALGLSTFDSVVHAMTSIATGGFSTHDASIAHFRLHPDAYPRYVAVEALLVVAMLAGGINFYVHLRLSRRQFAALYDSVEVRLLWLAVGVGTAIVAADRLTLADGPAIEWVWRALFEVASLVTTTGYELEPTGSFPRLSREVFLWLMFIGGCAGSTSGGIKLARLGILGTALRREARMLRLPRGAVSPALMDGQPITDAAFRQASFIVLLWVAYTAVAGFVVSVLAPGWSVGEAYSTALSAIGVVGPSFAPVARVAALPGVAKAVLIVGMLAGRLEILPLLVFFHPATWRR